MKKTFILLIFLSLIISVAAVSASDNATDVVAENITQDTLDAPQEDVLSDGDIDEVEDNGSEKASSELSSADVKGYTTFSSTVSVKLTSNGTALASKSVSILINGVTYNRITDSEGKASVSLKLPKGTYAATFTFLGDNMTNSSTATSTITIKDAIKTSLKLGDKDINYRQGSKCLFYVKLLDKNGKAIKNQIVTFKVAGKTYTARTNKNGVAKIFLNLKKGKYKVKYSFKKNSPYLSSSGSAKIKVKAKMPKGNGYWVWSAHMKKVNLKSLAKKGTKHIFLHVQSIGVHGKSAVTSFIKKAHKYGMKVHLWMQVCCVGNKWTRPVNPDGSLKYGFMNKKIKEAKRYAKIKGVDGIHFDYVRFGGTAHLYKTSVKAINYFCKKASIEVHKVNPNCIVSGALMPEPKAMHYYYGQDVPTMSKYMDALIPMVYKGNYHQKTSWIKSVTKTFVKQSNGAQIWTGLQSYHSDNNPKKLSQKSLLKDARAAMSGGAKGVILFRIGISCNFNFKKV
jgi:hypothetical protein